MTSPAQSLTDQLFDDSFSGAIDPFAVFEDWLALARDNEVNDPNAMAVATVDADGLPDVRMVLLNGRDSRGFVFFTNFGSAKGRQLLNHPSAALVMHWKSIRRQVRARGPVEIVEKSEADAYWNGRPRGSRIASSASNQSRQIPDRSVLTERVAQIESEVGEGVVPRPEHWSGFRIKPLAIEFWINGEHRLHDRMQFTRETVDSPWTRRRLAP
jgi:pyridoxamine 5'-phosphate oxidase